MNKAEIILSNLTDLAKSSLPVLDYASLGLGTGLSCALAYSMKDWDKETWKCLLRVLMNV